MKTEHYNLGLPEIVSVFPMLHMIGEADTNNNHQIGIAHNKDFNIGDTMNFGSKHFEVLEVTEKRKHNGRFREGVNALFYSLTCKQIN